MKQAETQKNLKRWLYATDLDVDEFVVKKLISAGVITHIGDLYQVRHKHFDCIEGVSLEKWEAFFSKIHFTFSKKHVTHHEISLQQFFYGLNLEDVDWEVAEDLAREFGSVEAFCNLCQNTHAVTERREKLFQVLGEPLLVLRVDRVITRPRRKEIHSLCNTNALIVHRHAEAVILNNKRVHLHGRFPGYTHKDIYNKLVETGAMVKKKVNNDFNNVDMIVVGIRYPGTGEWIEYAPKTVRVVSKDMALAELGM